MEKFSLYDFLGLLLPGFIFLFFGKIISKLFCIYPVFLASTNTELNIVIILSFSIILGSTLYALNFYLVKKKWYNKTFGMFKNLSELYLNMTYLHDLLNETLNKRANEWYKKDIFLHKNEFDKLDKTEREKIKELQDEYYSRMYYEIEYHGKNEFSKAFQSFYFFFRQGALAYILLLIGLLSLFGLHFIPCLQIYSPAISNVFALISLLLLLLFISVQLAKWYRKRMVMKMHWAYYTYLNSN